MVGCWRAWLALRGKDCWEVCGKACRAQYNGTMACSKLSEVIGFHDGLWIYAVYIRFASLPPIDCKQLRCGKTTQTRSGLCAFCGLGNACCRRCCCCASLGMSFSALSWIQLQMAGTRSTLQRFAKMPRTPPGTINAFNQSTSQVSLAQTRSVAL